MGGGRGCMDLERFLHILLRSHKDNNSILAFLLGRFMNMHPLFEYIFDNLEIVVRGDKAPNNLTRPI